MVTAPNQIDQKGLEISLQEIQKNYTSDGGALPEGLPVRGGRTCLVIRERPVRANPNPKRFRAR